MREVLVQVEHADGTAAVVRDEGMLWLTGILGRGGTGLEHGRPVVEGLPDDRTVQGGELPPGAVAVEVVDDAGVRHAAAVGNGAWIVVVDQPVRGEDPLVRFVDAAGRTVAPSLPAEWPRAPVEDASEPCPACGATGWDVVQPLDESRGSRSTADGGWEPTPIVVCRACGHEESVGVFTYVEDGDQVGDEPAWEPEEPPPAGFPVYAVRGRPARIGGWGDDSRMVMQGPLAVETEREDDEDESEVARARRALWAMLFDESSDWPARSEPGIAIWMSTQVRANRRAAARAAVEEHPIEIDGRPQPFQVARAGSRWAAVRRHGDLLVTVTGRDVPLADVALSA